MDLRPLQKRLWSWFLITSEVSTILEVCFERVMRFGLRKFIFVGSPRHHRIKTFKKQDKKMSANFDTWKRTKRIYFRSANSIAKERLEYVEMSMSSNNKVCVAKVQGAPSVSIAAKKKLPSWPDTEYELEMSVPSVLVKKSPPLSLQVSDGVPEFPVSKDSWNRIVCPKDKLEMVSVKSNT